MKTLHIVLGGVASALGLLWLTKEKTAGASSAAQPAPGPFLTPIPASTNPVSRTELPPATATVGPANVIVVWKGLRPASSVFDMNTNGVPLGTLLADFRITESNASGRVVASSEFAAPVLWVSPDGERIVFSLPGHSSSSALPAGTLLIAHRP